LTLISHCFCIFLGAVRGLIVSPRHPYLFSVAEDKMVKCWDLEYNKVIRHYHGHLSGVYSITLHPTIDIIVTGLSPLFSIPQLIFSLTITQYYTLLPNFNQTISCNDHFCCFTDCAFIQVVVIVWHECGTYAQKDKFMY
jgi:WD40 repeat protein